MANSNAQSEEIPVHEAPSLWTRLRYITFLTTLWITMKGFRWIRLARQRNTKTRPTFLRTYESRPNLPVRIFIPEDKDNQSSTPLPVLFTINGGAFVTGHPSDDDELNYATASQHGIAVIALNHGMFPFVRFPSALDDVEALLLSALSDASLPLDRTRVAISGCSSGGNLALGLCQRLKARDVPVAAVIVKHGSIDFSSTPSWMQSIRPYKPSLGGLRASNPDIGIGVNPAFRWFYTPYGISLRDPLLSPAWVARASLPPYIFFIQAELDILIGETWRTACRLAEREVPALDEVAGRKDPWGLFGAEALEAVIAGRAPVGVSEAEWTKEDRERFAWHDEWSGVRWLVVPDAVHAFENPAVYQFFEAEEAKDAAAKTEVMVREMGQWLLWAWKQPKRM